MARNKYWIYEEPSGADYAELIDFCARRCSKCTFVLQRPQQFAVNCYHFLDGLNPQLIKVANQMEWPGTKLTRSQAPVYWYRVTPELIAQIKTTVDGLYDWAVPNLPEDIALYWPDDTALLGTSSHERFAFVNLSNGEVEEFRHEVQSLHINEYPPPELI
jgi:hypothetical protein